MTQNLKNIARLGRPELWLSLALAFFTLAVYWQVSGFGFVNYDDPRYVSENATVRAGLSVDGVRWAFTTLTASNYHPLTWISHMLDVQFFGLEPGRHHLVSLFFHIANTLLLFCLFRKMTGDLWPSAFVAALFGLHPLHVESVAWIAERKDVLSGFFWLLTSLSYVFYVAQPSLKRYLPVFVFLGLGLLAKPMLVTLPFVLLLVDYWPLNRFRLSVADTARGFTAWQKSARLAGEKLPLLVLVIGSSVVTYVAQQRGGAIGSFESHPLGIRLANGLVAYVSYLQKTVWPLDLAVLYPHPGATISWLYAGGCLFFLLLVSGLVIWQARKRPYLLVGWFWYLGTLVPVLGLVQVGIQAMADRYTYIPLIGVFVALSWLLSEVLAGCRYRVEILASLAAASLLFLAGISWGQTRYWIDGRTLFSRAITVTANNYMAHNNLGYALAQQGRMAEAVSHYQQAVAIRPDFQLAHYNLALGLLDQSRLGEAARHFRESLRLKPDDVGALIGLGIILGRTGRTDEAIEKFREALHFQPDSARAHNNLGIALSKNGEQAEAIVHFREALRLDPNYVGANRNLELAINRQAQGDRGQ